MTIPKEIIEKMKQANSLVLEVDKWLDEDIDLEGSKHNHRRALTNEWVHPDYYQFTDEPNGEEQCDGEYCDQWSIGESGDCFNGFYYYPTESGEYFYFEFFI